MDVFDALSIWSGAEPSQSLLAVAVDKWRDHIGDVNEMIPTSLKIVTEEEWEALTDQYAAAEYHIDHTERAMQMCWDGLQHIRTEMLGCTMFETPIPVQDLLAHIADISLGLEKHAAMYKQKPDAAITTATQEAT